MPVSSGRRPTWLVVTGIVVAAACLAPLGSVLKQATAMQAGTNDRLPQKLPRPGSGGTTARTAETKPAFPVRTWQAPADLLEHLSGSVRPEDETPDPDPFGPPPPWRADSVQQALHLAGVPFPRGTWAVHDPYLGTLEACHELDQLDQIDAILTRLGPLPQWTIDRGLFDPGPGRQGPAKGWETDYRLVEHKLRTIIIPEVHFEETTYAKAVEFLNAAAREHDPEESDPQHRGVKISLEKPRLEDGSIGHGRVKDLHLINVPIVTVLQYMCDAAALRFRIEDGGVTIIPTWHGHAKLETWRCHVAPEVTEQVRLQSGPYRAASDDPFADPGEPAISHEQWVKEQRSRPLIDVFKDLGISFPEGAKVEYSPETSRMLLVNTPSNLDLFEVLFEGNAYILSKERFEAEQGR